MAGCALWGICWCGVPSAGTWRAAHPLPHAGPHTWPPLRIRSPTLQHRSMIVVGFSQVTEVALSTPDGRSLADPARQYPWTGEAKLVVLDALGDMQMPLTGGSLPEPGGEGSVFDSPLFVTVEVGWRVGGWRGLAGVAVCL